MFGQGDIRGVIGPESANNADNGGALIPTLMFGIPGSGSMAVFLGGLILIGVEPGIGMMARDLDLTYIIIWSLALANVIGTATCLLLAKPIARMTLVPFAMLAPFMIVIIYFAAYQATRSWYDFMALFVLGVLGMYMKRFGWSRPALLIGYVLAMRLDAAVYQSIQVYGMAFLERTGVQVMIGLIVVSIVLAVRMKPHRAPLTPNGRYAPLKPVPEMIFLGVMAAFVTYVVYESIRLTFLARVFPLSVALICLVLLGVMAAAFLRKQKRPSYLFYDSEREWIAHETPVHSDLHYQAWMLGMLGSVGVIGFLPGVFAFITVFLRVKARVAWHRAALAACGAIGVFVLLSHLLVLDYPRGILQYLVELPWPLG
jgi:hypothetical protein